MFQPPPKEHREAKDREYARVWITILEERLQEAVSSLKEQIPHIIENNSNKYGSPPLRNRFTAILHPLLTTIESATDRYIAGENAELARANIASLYKTLPVIKMPKKPRHEEVKEIVFTSCQPDPPYSQSDTADDDDE